MKPLLPNSLAAQGLTLPPMKTDPEIIEAQLVTVPAPPAFRPAPTMSPRYEPTNITQTATAMGIQNAIREAEHGNTFNLFRFYRDILLSDNHDPVRDQHA